MAGAEKLKRLLDLIPILHANPGISLAELKDLAGFRRRSELVEGLNKLMMMGVPPFSPADFIDVYLDDEDRVYLEFPQGLERPLALTPSEWAAVQWVLDREQGALGAGQKAREVGGLIARFSAVPVADESGDPFQSKRELVEEALEDILQIEFKYRTLSSREPEIRRVDPWLLFQHRGVTYLIAYCYLRQAPRHFHLERMEDVEILDVEQTTRAPDDLDEFMKNSPIFRATPAGFTVRLAFAPALRPALEQFFRLNTLGPFEPDEVAGGPADVSNEAAPETDAPAGGAPASSAPSTRDYFRDWLVGECKVQESIWFRTTLRSLGPGSLILAPTHLRLAYAEDLDRIEVPEPL